MNGDTWDSLNADEQAIITAAGKVFEERSVDIALGLRDEYKQTVEDAGISVYTVTAEEQQLFVDGAMPVFEEVKTEVSGPGLELLEILESLR